MVVKKRNKMMQKHICDICGWIYDPEKGLMEKGIKPKTSFEDLPEDFICPECGVGKDQFSIFTE